MVPFSGVSHRKNLNQEPDEIKCCREKGVPVECFGYCLKERNNAESRAITGVCEKWLKQMGQCREGLLILYIHKFYNVWYIS